MSDHRTDAEIIAEVAGAFLGTAPRQRRAPKRVDFRNTTHEYVCMDCGVSMKGRECSGRIVASNAAPSGETHPCLCVECQS